MEDISADALYPHIHHIPNYTYISPFEEYTPEDSGMTLHIDEFNPGGFLHCGISEITEICEGKEETLGLNIYMNPDNAFVITYKNGEEPRTFRNALITSLTQIKEFFENPEEEISPSAMAIDIFIVVDVGEPRMTKFLLGINRGIMLSDSLIKGGLHFTLEKCFESFMRELDLNPNTALFNGRSYIGITYRPKDE